VRAWSSVSTRWPQSSPDNRQSPAAGALPFSCAPATERMVHDMQESPSAERFVEELEKHRSPEQREKYERHFQTGEGQIVEGAVGSLFAHLRPLSIRAG
jgi:hypothetical protein